MREKKHLYFLFVFFVLLILSCNLPSKLETTLASPTIDALTVMSDAGEQVTVSPTEAIPDPSVEETPLPLPDVEEQAAPSPTEDLPPPPPFEEITWPEENPLEERDGKWYLNEQPVALSYHRNADGEKELWLTLKKETHWPVMIQGADGTWKTGIEVWNGKLTIINTNESPLTLTIYSMMEGNKLEELGNQEITPYEIFKMTSLPPTYYEFRFQFTVDEEFDLICAVTLRQDSRLTFVVVPAGIAVSEPDFVPESSRDLDLRFSPLCGG